MTYDPRSADRPHLLCFGCGYSATALARKLVREGWRVTGTTRTADGRDALAAAGIEPVLFDGTNPSAEAEAALAVATDLLASVPPGEAGDPVLLCHGTAIEAAQHLRWIGYLSTTGVYGDTGGAEVDETAAVNPSNARSRRRVDAEHAWLELFERSRRPVHVFRLAGIYGPHRSVLEAVRAGRAKRIARPGHLFSRIHVDDIATVLRASMARPDPGRVYNVADDEPAEPAAVTAYACELLGIEPPPAVPFEEAAAEMTPMAKSFWQDNRRVANGRMKRELGIELAYPTYREGLARILAAERTG